MAEARIYELRKRSQTKTEVEIYNNCQTDAFYAHPEAYKSYVLLHGTIPDDSFAIGIKERILGDGSMIEETVVPFTPYECYLNQSFMSNSQKNKRLEYFLEWINKGGLNRVVGFIFRRDLTFALKCGDTVGIYIDPISGSEVREREMIIIPSRYVKNVVL